MHTPTYKSSRSVKKWKLPQKSEWQLPSGDGEVGVGKGLGRGKWGLLGAGKFPACYLSQYRPHQFSFCDIEYLCCIYFPVCLLYYTAIKARETKLFSLSVIKQWNSPRLLHHIKLWVKDEGKNAFQG